MENEARRAAEYNIDGLLLATADLNTGGDCIREGDNSVIQRKSADPAGDPFHEDNRDRQYRGHGRSQSIPEGCDRIHQKKPDSHKFT